MSETIEIRLSTAQRAALDQEAKAKGLKFFDHCRAKLLAGTAVKAADVVNGAVQAAAAAATVPVRAVQPMQQPVLDDQRLSRLEAMMAEMGEVLVKLANPLIAATPDNLPQAEDPSIDVDAIIGQSLQEAERQGLTVVEREAPAADGGVRHIGTRRPAPYSVSNVPQHLRNLV